MTTNTMRYFIEYYGRLTVTVTFCAELQQQNLGNGDLWMLFFFRVKRSCAPWYIFYLDQRLVLFVLLLHRCVCVWTVFKRVASPSKHGL